MKSKKRRKRHQNQNKINKIHEAEGGENREKKEELREFGYLWEMNPQGFETRSEEENQGCGRRKEKRSVFI